MKMKKFVIISKYKENNRASLDKLKEALLTHGYVYDEENPEYIFVLGGDGSLLRSIHQYRKEGKYILLNTGHLGFFSDYDADDIDNFVTDLLTKEPLETRLPLYEIESDDIKDRFINDIAIQSAQTSFLDIYVDDELLTCVRSNGIVISSPMGSTGYLTSLNSPLVIGSPSIYQYAIIAPCYNRLSLNPITKAILSNDQVLKIKVRDGNPDVYIDGIFKEELEKSPDGTLFTIRARKDEFVRILHFKDTSLVKRLRKNISGMED
jgi:probable inorganic polyphosphate/ATP-NAD kinase